MQSTYRRVPVGDRFATRAIYTLFQHYYYMRYWVLVYLSEYFFQSMLILLALVRDPSILAIGIDGYCSALSLPYVVALIAHYHIL